nr:zinc finger, CCHC-type [Tanacetum cinerariifolium]
EFNRKNFQKRTKDMLTSKWTTLNHHCQKFNAIYKRCHRLKKSGENEVDLMGRARVMYQDESRNSPFNHEKAWAILRQHAKWDAPELALVELTEDETGDFHATVNTEELFGADPRPRPPGKQRPEKKPNSTHRRAPGEVNRPNSDTLEAKYMAEYALSKKFLVSNFTNYKMTDSRPVLEQYNELLGILKRFTQHKMDMDKSIQVSCIIYKLSPSWKDFKHTLKHLKEELTLVELGSYLRIEESLKAHDNDKTKGNSVDGHSVVNMRDAIFDENRFSSVSRLSQRSLVNGTEDSGGLVVPKKITDEDDPKMFDEAMKSQNVAFWKEAINDKMDSIMGNNTWVLVDLPSGCKPLGCKWIFKIKLKLDGTVKKFKVRLVIHGFKQKSGIDYFNTYAPVACISTIRLLIAMTSIHNLIIHQIDVKTTFLNGKLEEEVYMNQLQGFIMPSNENKVCKMINPLYGLKQTPKEWHQKFNEVVLSNGYLLNQANKCVYSKFDESGILSLRFSMKDLGDADVILGIKIKHESNGMAISQSHYIKKASKKQTCSTSSTMESEIVALAAAGKEAEWLKNLLLEIPLWVKPIEPILSAVIVLLHWQKPYNQMYNGKSRHLGVKHSMIRKLITNGVVSIEFVRSQQSLAGHLTKGLARDLVIKSADRMGLKSN